MKYTHSEIDNIINYCLKQVAKNVFGTITVAKVHESIIQNAMKNGGIIEINFHPEILRIDLDAGVCTLRAPKTSNSFGI